MYCEHCLKIILQKLNSNDIIILEFLANENATIPQCSLSFNSICENIVEKKLMTSNNVYTSLKRLNEFGFVETQKWTRKNKYYVTIAGTDILKLIESKLNQGVM